MTEVDAMLVWFGPEEVKSAGTEEVAPGIMLDFDSDGRVIGERAYDAAEGCGLILEARPADFACRRREPRQLGTLSAPFYFKRVGLLA